MTANNTAMHNMAIRNTAKALLVSNGRILVNRCVTQEGGVYYDLPGGGQHMLETMEEAVIREVLEETGRQRLQRICPQGHPYFSGGDGRRESRRAHGDGSSAERKRVAGSGGGGQGVFRSGTAERQNFAAGPQRVPALSGMRALSVVKV